MNFLEIIATIFTITALGGYLNHKIFKLPTTIGLLVFSSFISIFLVVGENIGLLSITPIAKAISEIDFNKIFLHGMLSILLFAGAMHIHINELKAYKYPIFIFSTLGVAIATFATGYLLFYISNYLGFHLPLIAWLLFSALISPTDAVSILSILKEQEINAELKSKITKITGEALFNDGVAIVLFMILLSLIFGHDVKLSVLNISFMLIKEILGGVILGLILGYIFFILIKTIDAYQIEILMTLSLAIGSYALAEFFHVSAPIATVTAGLVIGNTGRNFAMSEKTREHLDNFWELLDDIFNSVLFVLIGIQLVLIKFNYSLIKLCVAAIVTVLIGRYISILLSGLTFFNQYNFHKIKTPILMTWGGLRGGISIALVLSIPNSELKNTLITLTFAVVFFSIIFQGLTFKYLFKFLNK